MKKRKKESVGKRGKGGTSFVSVVKEALDNKITDVEEIVKLAKKAIPASDEKKLRARVNATIKYLGKKPEKKVKVEKLVKEEKKKEVKKEEVVEKKTEVKETQQVAEVKESETEIKKEETEVKTPEEAQAKLGEAISGEEKDTELGDIVLE